MAMQVSAFRSDLEPVLDLIPEFYPDVEFLVMQDATDTLKSDSHSTFGFAESTSGSGRGGASSSSSTSNSKTAQSGASSSSCTTSTGTAAGTTSRPNASSSSREDKYSSLDAVATCCYRGYLPMTVSFGKKSFFAAKIHHERCIRKLFTTARSCSISTTSGATSSSSTAGPIEAANGGNVGFGQEEASSASEFSLSKKKRKRCRGYTLHVRNEVSADICEKIRQFTWTNKPSDNWLTADLERLYRRNVELQQQEYFYSQTTQSSQPTQSSQTTQSTCSGAGPPAGGDHHDPASGKREADRTKDGHDDQDHDAQEDDHDGEDARPGGGNNQKQTINEVHKQAKGKQHGKKKMGQAASKRARKGARDRSAAESSSSKEKTADEGSFAYSSAVVSSTKVENTPEPLVQRSESAKAVKFWSVFLYYAPPADTTKTTSGAPSDATPCTASPSDPEVLVAGEIGYTTGGIYTSCTGFYDTKYSGAGSAQLLLLGQLLAERGYQIWDLGMSMRYKEEVLGASEVSRTEWLRHVTALRDKTDLTLAAEGYSVEGSLVHEDGEGGLVDDKDARTTQTRTTTSRASGVVGVSREAENRVKKGPFNPNARTSGDCDTS
ncbi:unnamed protein product [Amoebophrya sp. A25]|nr:unnamed protein product [Amoebophrya sp. A25]|eukprot:GSA25T00019394001.1